MTIGAVNLLISNIIVSSNFSKMSYWLSTYCDDLKLSGSSTPFIGYISVSLTF